MDTQKVEAAVKLMGAEKLQELPIYMMDRAPLLAEVKHKLRSLHRDKDRYHQIIASSTFVYYLPQYLSPEVLPELLTQTPYIATSGDSNIILQRSALSHKSYNSYRSAKDVEPSLLTYEQRRLARNRVIVTDNEVYAVGGYGGPDAKLLDEPFEAFIISAAGPQFEHEALDFADFILASSAVPGGSKIQRLLQYKHLGIGSGEVWPPSFEEARKEALHEGRSFLILNDDRFLFHLAGYRQSMQENFHLYLSAFNGAVKHKNHQLKDKDPRVSHKSGYLKIVSLGAGYFADVALTRPHCHVGKHVKKILLESLSYALRTYEYDAIAKIETCDFSPPSFTLKETEINGIEIVPGHFKDCLQFDQQTIDQFHLGVLNPGDCFALVGNETTYSSVESAIGNNTSLRLTQQYLFNPYLLDENRYVPVHTQ